MISTIVQTYDPYYSFIDWFIGGRTMVYETYESGWFCLCMTGGKQLT